MAFVLFCFVSVLTSRVAALTFVCMSGFMTLAGVVSTSLGTPSHKLGLSSSSPARRGCGVMFSPHNCHSWGSRSQLGSCLSSRNAAVLFWFTLQTECLTNAILPSITVFTLGQIHSETQYKAYGCDDSSGTRIFLSPVQWGYFCKHIFCEK